MTRWEYKWLVVHDEKWSLTLILFNESGKEGWEYTGHNEDRATAVAYLMKRELENDGR